jgi:hypothetical protein
VALDLFKGITKRNWAREPDRLLTVPAPSAAVETPAEAALRRARELDSKLRVRPAAGRGAVLTTKWKWG